VIADLAIFLAPGANPSKRLAPQRVSAITT
jgi:hypothetical protein